MPYMSTGLVGFLLRRSAHGVKGLGFKRRHKVEINLCSSSHVERGFSWQYLVCKQREPTLLFYLVEHQQKSPSQYTPSLSLPPQSPPLGNEKVKKLIWFHHKHKKRITRNLVHHKLLLQLRIIQINKTNKSPATPDKKSRVMQKNPRGFSIKTGRCYTKVKQPQEEKLELHGKRSWTNTRKKTITALLTLHQWILYRWKQTFSSPSEQSFTSYTDQQPRASRADWWAAGVKSETGHVSWPPAPCLQSQEHHTQCTTPRAGC